MTDKRRPVNILITTSASLLVPNIIKCMRESHRFKYRIIGVDAKTDGVGAKFADEYYVVPMGNHGDKYIAAMLDLCCQKRIDILLPISDEENLTLSEHKDVFEHNGVKVLCNNYEATRIALCKDSALEKLENHGIDVPFWNAPKNIDEFDEGLSYLGFPDLDVVIKPVSARGSRGFRIIKEDFDEFHQIYNEKQEIYIKPERIKRLLAEQDNFPAVLLMEYLPGDSYSIDIFAEAGQAKCIVPHKRKAYRWGFVDKAHMVPYQELSSVCHQIVEAFNFDNLLNIELNENTQGEPKLVEINPRASATLAQNRLTGLNILDMAVASALKEPIERIKEFNHMEYILYWEEAVTDLGKKSFNF